MTTPEDAIRARRRLSNTLIARHDAAKLRSFFDPMAKVVVGDGALIVGADEVIGAFAVQFADPAFIAYVRTPDTVELDQEGQRAAEQGRWVGTWRRGLGETRMSGTYLAVWRKASGQWLIEAELYVTLAEG